MKRSYYLAIPIAAFALAATSVSAFNPEVLSKAGLSEVQIAAFEEAKELRKQGDRDAARDVLAAAGIDLDTLEEVRRATHAEREEHRSAVKSAISEGDYETFSELTENGRLGEVIDTEAEFNKLKEAHELRDAGDKEGARIILKELGLKPGHGHGKRGSHRGHFEERGDKRGE